MGRNTFPSNVPNSVVRNALNLNAEVNVPASVVRTSLTLLFVILLCCCGGVLFAVSSEWSHLSYGLASNGFLKDLQDGSISYVVFSISTAILTTAAVANSSRDAYYLRRFTVFFAFFLMLWASFYVDTSAYHTLSNLTDTPHGPVDWLIGTNENYDDTRKSWFHQLVGLSLLGMMLTTVPGFVYYCCGYGWECMLAGSCMAFCYELGKVMPPTFSLEVSEKAWAEFFFGTWLWLVILISALGRRENPHNSPKYIPGNIGRFVFSATTLLVTVTIIVSAVFSWINPPSPLRNRTAFGLTFLCVSCLAAELVFFLSVACWRSWDPAAYARIQSDEELHDPNAQLICGIIPVHTCFPRAKAPYKLFLFILRFLVGGWMLALLGLIFYVIFYDKIQHPSAADSV